MLSLFLAKKQPSSLKTYSLAGFPLLGYTGGFYLGGKGVNYLKAENKRAIALVQLPIILLTLALFLALTLLRVFQPSRNAFVQGEVQVLAYASFYFSVTDVGLGLIEAFPSPALCVRRWNIWVFAALWLSWLALILVTFLVPTSISHKSGRMGSVSQILMFFVKPSTQTPLIYIEVDVYARTLDDFVIVRSYGVYSDLERPWLLVKNLDGPVENTHLYVGISTVFFFNCVHEREMN